MSQYDRNICVETNVSNMPCSSTQDSDHIRSLNPIFTAWLLQTKALLFRAICHTLSVTSSMPSPNDAWPELPEIVVDATVGCRYSMTVESQPGPPLMAEPSRFTMYVRGTGDYRLIARPDPPGRPNIRASSDESGNRTSKILECSAGLASPPKEPSTKCPQMGLTVHDDAIIGDRVYSGTNGSGTVRPSSTPSSVVIPSGSPARRTIAGPSGGVAGPDRKRKRADMIEDSLEYKKNCVFESQVESGSGGPDICKSPVLGSI